MKKFIKLAGIISSLIMCDSLLAAGTYYNPQIDPKDQSILNFFSPRLGLSKRTDWNNIPDVICEPDACSKDKQIVCYRGKKDPGTVNNKKSCQQQQRERLYKFIAPKVPVLSQNGLPGVGEVVALQQNAAQSLNGTKPSVAAPIRTGSNSTNQNQQSQSNSHDQTQNQTHGTNSTTTNTQNQTNNNGNNTNGTNAAIIAGVGGLGIGALIGSGGGGSQDPDNGNKINTPIIPGSASNVTSGPVPVVPGVPVTVIPEPKAPSAAVCSIRGAKALRINIDKVFASAPLTDPTQKEIREKEWAALKAELVAIVPHTDIKVKQAKLKAIYNTNNIYQKAMSAAYPSAAMKNISVFSSCYKTLKDSESFNSFINAFLDPASVSTPTSVPSTKKN